MLINLTHSVQNTYFVKKYKNDGCIFKVVVQIAKLFFYLLFHSYEI